MEEDMEEAMVVTTAMVVNMATEELELEGALADMEASEAEAEATEVEAMEDMG